MNPKLIINLFFIGLAVLLLLLSHIVLPLQSNAEETSSVSDVLGRTVRLDALCDDFEDINWSYNPQTEVFNKKLWRGGSGRGVPELLKRITTPDGGKDGSIGALEIRTNETEIYKDNYPNQEDLLTAEYEQILKHKLTRADQPVFIVRVWLPPFDQWGDQRSFGFRHESFLENGAKDQHYSTIWLVYDRSIKPKPFLKYRIGTNELFYEVYDPRLIEQDGWLTIAYGHKIKKHKGIGIPTNKGVIDNITITSLLTKYGKDALMMKYINYSFFSLGYPISGNTSPRFVIDDYEVWVVKDNNE